MGWFRAVGASGDKETRSRVASVRRAADGSPAGAAVILGIDTVLTCAHVVNDALGRDLFDARTPRLDDVFVALDGPRGTVRFPAGGGAGGGPPPGARGGRLGGDGGVVGEPAGLRGVA
ncbi:serine protease, partial [Streptomyces sp. NPDC059755]